MEGVRSARRRGSRLPQTEPSEEEAWDEETGRVLLLGRPARYRRSDDGAGRPEAVGDPVPLGRPAEGNLHAGLRRTEAGREPDRAGTSRGSYDNALPHGPEADRTQGPSTETIGRVLPLRWASG